MRFLLDNNLPRRVARAINELIQPEDKVDHLQDLFAPDTPDTVWIAALGHKSQYVVICGDPKIMRRPHERRALEDAKLTVFFLKPGWTNLEFWPQAIKLIQWWPDIMATARRVTAGAAFLVPVQYSGKFEQVRLR